MLLGLLRFRLACYLCFGTVTYVQEVKFTPKKKQTILPQLRLPSTSFYKATAYFYSFLKKAEPIRHGMGSCKLLLIPLLPSIPRGHTPDVP